MGINVPPGVLPSDAITSSPVLMVQHGFGRGTSGTTGFNGNDSGFDEFDGIDPSLDPDVAMAIRAALEEALAMSRTDDAAATDEPIKHLNSYHQEHDHSRFLMKKESGNNNSRYTDSLGNAFLDPAFINDLLVSVDVDGDDPMVQAALAQMGVDREDEKIEDDKDSSSNKKRKGDEDGKE